MTHLLIGVFRKEESYLVFCYNPLWKFSKFQTYRDFPYLITNSGSFREFPSWDKYRLLSIWSISKIISAGAPSIPNPDAVPFGTPAFRLAIPRVPRPGVGLPEMQFLLESCLGFGKTVSNPSCFEWNISYTTNWHFSANFALAENFWPVLSINKTSGP